MNFLLFGLVVAFLIAITVITVKRKKKYLVVLLLMLIPTCVFALDLIKIDVNISFEEVFIKGKFLQYRVQVKNGDQETIDSDITYGEPVGELPEITPKPGYNSEGWVDQNNNAITPETTVTEDLVITPNYDPIIYRISYNLNDGVLLEDNTESYTVEDEVVLNNPTKEGYTFSGWTSDGGETYQTEYTIPKGTMGDITLVASFSANQDTKYTVIHRQMDMNGVYQETETEELHGATDTEVTPQRKSYTGFTAPAAQTKTIAGNGSTTFTYDYARNQYTFSVSDRSYITQNSTANGTYYYGTQIKVTAQERVGYTFKWNDNSTNLTKEFTLTSNTVLTPNYTPNTNTVYHVYHKQMNMDGETYTLRDSQELHGTTGATITPDTNTYEGFTAPVKQTVTINGDGSTEVEYLYTRNKYYLTLENPEYIETTINNNTKWRILLWNRDNFKSKK